MRATLLKTVKMAALALGASVLTIVAVRAWDAQRQPPLAPWHTLVPAEPNAAALDGMTWPDYLAAEQRAFDVVQREVSAQLDEADRVPGNRYFDGSPMHRARLATDWNASFAWLPAGPPKGAVVLLHGLTDAPYSLHHVAQRYRDLGWVAVGIRLPGHGTVPGGLTTASWEQWLAATRLAVREARRLVPQGPLHVVGYSNGGALAVKYALDSLEAPALPRPDQLVLLSPMIGVTAFARFAGLLGIPAFFAAFAQAAWLDVVPEFNPFKYNSFPVNAARQSSQLTRALQGQVARMAREGRLAAMPPVLGFQSVMDSTVSTPAVVTGLYQHLPRNGSELVVFDLNRGASLDMLLRPDARVAIERLLPAPPRNYRVTIITADRNDLTRMVELSTPAGATEYRSQALELHYPPDVFSLSHLALPFPLDDDLYGATPPARAAYGVQLGRIAPRGERGTLVLPVDTLVRMTSNPFYPYLQRRVEEAMAGAK